MRLSEKLEEALWLAEQQVVSYGDAEKIVATLAAHADDLRQALRDSDRLVAAPVCVVNIVHTFAEAGDLIGIDSPYETGMSVGQRVRLVIEDAAMGRREGDGNG